MSQEAFTERWEAERAMYRAWGDHLSQTIIAALGERISPTATSYFLKAAVEPRVKDDAKLVEKAFYRSKPYTNPYDDITDKVGTRFVVLLGSDIETVVDVLQAVPDWTFSLDRDYEEEQKKNPVAFDYAAKHFVVRPTKNIEIEGLVIAAGTPCEVQIKTILQHAYSELTHDTIYKPQIDATPTMRRNAAKSMALLEATNDYFEKVAADVKQILASMRDITHKLGDIYQDAVGTATKASLLEGLLLAAYEPGLTADYDERVSRLLADKPYIAENIRSRIALGNPVFAQPSILLAYLSAFVSLEEAVERWPLTLTELEPLLNDLGESLAG